MKVKRLGQSSFKVIEEDYLIDKDLYNLLVYLN